MQLYFHNPRIKGSFHIYMFSECKRREKSCSISVQNVHLFPLFSNVCCHLWILQLHVFLELSVMLFGVELAKMRSNLIKLELVQRLPHIDVKLILIWFLRSLLDQHRRTQLRRNHTSSAFHSKSVNNFLPLFYSL